MNPAEALERLMRLRDNLAGALNPQMRKDRRALDVAIALMKEAVRG